MASSKKKVNISDILIFGFFVIFPLGQLLRLRLLFFQRPVTLYPIDVFVIIALSIFILRGGLKKLDSRVFTFFYASLFSLFISKIYFSFTEILPGFLYLIRFFAYFLFLFFVFEYSYRSRYKKQLLLNSLLSASFFTTLFGWFQYFLYPDLRFLKYLGWDDHLYRLVGTFLDPVYIGLIIVFGALISFDKFLVSKKYWFFVLFCFFVLALSLTYSRASYLSFLSGMVALLIKSSKNFKRYFLFLFIGFVSILLFLPRPAGEGVRLERIASIFARARSYSEVLTIFKTHPLLGIGFNNICSYRAKYFTYSEIGKFSNACYGVDSSLLLVLATTGTLGFLSFFSTFYILLENLRFEERYLNLFLSVATAVFVHSLFSNSFFYSFILGFLAILFPISVKVFRVYKKE